MRGREFGANGVRSDKEASRGWWCSLGSATSSSGRSFLLGLVAGWCLHYLRNDAAALVSFPTGGGWPSLYQGGYFGNLSCDSSLRTTNHLERLGTDGSNDGSTGNGDDNGYNSSSDDSDSPKSSLPTFTHLVNASGSDKYARHHYERYYTPWLEPYRHVPGLKILEIGARDGKSLTLWDKYFTNSSLIVGLAYKYGTDQLPERLVGLRHNVTLHFGDQSKLETMQALAAYGPFDIIIDDGSHVPQHVAFSLFSLWDKSVKAGGLYVIEDIETSYWRNGSEIYGYTLVGTGIGASPERSIVTKLEQIQQVLFRRQIGARNLVNVLPGDEDLCSVEWGMNLVALRKCIDDDASSAKPPFQPSCVDKTEMEAWIQEARRTNPTGYLGDASVAAAEHGAVEAQNATA
jgi:hypothetical protein